MDQHFRVHTHTIVTTADTCLCDMTDADYLANTKAILIASFPVFTTGVASASIQARLPMYTKGDHLQFHECIHNRYGSVKKACMVC